MWMLLTLKFVAMYGIIVGDGAAGAAHAADPAVVAEGHFSFVFFVAAC